MRRLFISFAFVFFASGVPAWAAPPTQIVVQGTATIATPPQQAIVSASIETNSPKAASAVSDNNAVYDRVSAALGRAGIDRDALQLSSYDLSFVPKPNVLPSGPPPYEAPQYGYTVTRQFSITVAPASKAGEVIDDAVRAGITNIDGVTFGVSNPSTEKVRATAKAVADARAKADAVAKAAGLHIVGIKRIDIGSIGIPPPQPMLRMNVMAEAVPTHLDVGNVSVSSQVTVIFLAAP
jgi:uncharacterized protein YggE